MTQNQKKLGWLAGAMLLFVSGTFVGAQNPGKVFSNRGVLISDRKMASIQLKPMTSEASLAIENSGRSGKSICAGLGWSFVGWYYAGGTRYAGCDAGEYIDLIEDRIPEPDRTNPYENAR